MRESPKFVKIGLPQPPTESLILFPVRELLESQSGASVRESKAVGGCVRPISDENVQISNFRQQ